MLVANGCHSADLFHATKHMGGNIGTARMVAQIFCQQLFASVRSCEAGLNRYLRNGKSP